MEQYRCGRCQVILASVAAPAGEPSSLIFNPLVERRLLAAAARHRSECVRGDHLDPVDPATGATDQ